MNNKGAFLFLFLVAGCVATVVSGGGPRRFTARADIPNAVQQQSLTAATPGPWLNLAGQNSCGLTFSTVGVGVTAVVEGSTDNGATAFTLTQFTGSGSFNPPVAATQYSGATVSSTTQALTNIRVHVTAYSSGTVAWILTCTAAGGVGSGGSGGVISGTVAISPNPVISGLTAIPTVSPGGGGAVVPVNAAGSPYPASSANIPYVGIANPATGTPAPYDLGGLLLLSAGCSKFTTAAGGTTTSISAVAAHFCGYMITTALTVMQFGCWNNSSTLTGVEVATSAVGAGVVAVPVVGGKVWMTTGITCGSAATGLGAATVFWDN